MILVWFQSEVKKKAVKFLLLFLFEVDSKIGNEIILESNSPDL